MNWFHPFLGSQSTFSQMQTGMFALRQLKAIFVPPKRMLIETNFNLLN